MQTKKNILPFLLLLSVLFSFSINAINSINTASSTIFHSDKKISNPINANTSSTENFVFEELENDNEDITTDLFLLVPFYNLTCSISKTTLLSSRYNNFLKAIEPIFIAIRVLRI